MSDPLQLLVGAVTLFLPGLLLLLVCGVTSARVAVGLAPAVTLALFQVAALAGGVVSITLPWAVVALTAVLGLLLVLLEVRRGRSGAVRTLAVQTALAVTSRPVPAAVSAGLLTTAVYLGITTWTRGFGGLDTPPQEHDTVLHTLITAYIARTGHASPFDVMPVDLATGDDPRYYPAAMHTFAGLLTHLSDDPVSGLNAATALLLGLAGPISLFAAVSSIERRGTRPVFGAVAALISVTLYRPTVQLIHDAGILAFAAGLALVPALATSILALRRRDPRTAVVTALVGLALFTLHPSIAIIAAIVTVLVVATCLLLAPARAWLLSRVSSLAMAVGLLVVAVAPWAVASVTVAGSVAGYPESPPSDPLGTVAGRIGGFFYGGFFDPAAEHFQLFVAVLFWIGVVGCLTRRALWPLLVAWAAWAAAALLYASGHADLPVLRQLGQVFFNSWVRIASVSSVLAPAIAGLGMAALASLAHSRLRERERGQRVWAVLPSVLATVLAASFVLTSGLAYRETNIDAISERYSDPSFYRLAPDEREAFDFLAEQPDVGRVMNNGNDGSTFLYVYDGIPVVNTYPLGMPEARYGIYLMEHFNQIGTNAEVRCLVQRWDITHVIVSLTSPGIGVAGAPDRWVRTKLFSYAPGLFHLDRVPQVRTVFFNDDTAVFAIDPAIVHGDDRDACSADPEFPGPPGSDD